MSSHSRQHTEVGVALDARRRHQGGEALVDIVFSCELMKISGFHKPSKANEAAFLAAVEEIAGLSSNLLGALETNAPPRNRAEEANKARYRAAQRF